MQKQHLYASLILSTLMANSALATQKSPQDNLPDIPRLNSKIEKRLARIYDELEDLNDEMDKIKAQLNNRQTDENIGEALDILQQINKLRKEGSTLPHDTSSRISSSSETDISPEAGPPSLESPSKSNESPQHYQHMLPTGLLYAWLVYQQLNKNPKNRRLHSHTNKKAVGNPPLRKATHRSLS